MPLISWVAPVFNKESYIAETIESIIGQTFKDSEIIFVDDGSTDGTCDVIEYYMKQDKRIKLHRIGKNVGLGKAWNIGHSLVETPLILVASGDDIWDKDRAKITYNYFHAHPDKDVFYGSFWFCDDRLEKTEYKPAVPYDYKRLVTPREDGFCPQYIGHFVMGYTTKIAKKVKMRDLRVGIDYPFLVDLANAKANFGWTSKTLGYARLLKSGVSLSRRKEVYENSKV